MLKAREVGLTLCMESGGGDGFRYRVAVVVLVLNGRRRTLELHDERSRSIIGVGRMLGGTMLVVSRL